MGQWITGAKLVVLALFLTATAAMAVYDVFYVMPARRCESQGAWWDSKDRQCLTPIPIWRLTGRSPITAGAEALAQRLAPGTQSVSPPAAAERAATKSRSESRLR
ncbi:MAG TPA: hypothetical protein VGS12_08590 [Caulobacteraceae bacterium]|nr:hypothetical protein [Caulobacteraceae bacterium]